MNVFLLQLRSLLDGAEITAAAERSRSFRAIFPLKHQIVSRSAALAYYGHRPTVGASIWLLPRMSSHVNLKITFL